jgi:hypothetical protein
MGKSNKSIREKCWDVLKPLISSGWAALSGFVSCGGVAPTLLRYTEWMPLSYPSHIALAIFVFTPVLSLLVAIGVLVFIVNIRRWRQKRRLTCDFAIMCVCLVTAIGSVNLFYLVEDGWKTAAHMDYFMYYILVPLCWALPFGLMAGFVTSALLLLKDAYTNRGGID